MSPNYSTSKPIARFAKPDDINKLWWLERTSGKEDLFPYALFQTYVSNREKLKRHAIVLELRLSSERQLIGFVFFRYNKLIHATNLVIDPNYRKKGYGRKLLHVLTRLPHPYPENAPVSVRVRESDLASQLFLKSAGFACVGIIPEPAFDCPPEPAYAFYYEAPLKP